jgi:hypothetical protein
MDVPLALRTREQLGELAASQPGLLREDVEAGDASSRSAATRATAPTRRAWNRCRTSASSPRSCPSGSRRRGACNTTSITCTPSTSTRCTRSGGCTRSSAAITRRVPGPQRDDQGDHAARWRWRWDAAARRRQAVRQPAQRDWRRTWRCTICRRLGIEEEDIKRIDFLVRQHLVMGQMSQRRDLEDLGMISDFAGLCGNEENLRELYLLTFCDLASVAPDAMSSWKETLLAELYTRTMTFLRRGPDLLGLRARRSRRRAAARRARLLGVAEGDAALTALFAGFPDRYFAENVETKIAAHVRQVRRGAIRARAP